MLREGTRVAGSVGRAGGAAHTVAPPPMISPFRVVQGAPRRVPCSLNISINLDINTDKNHPYHVTRNFNDRNKKFKHRNIKQVQWRHSSVKYK